MNNRVISLVAISVLILLPVSSAIGKTTEDYDISKAFIEANHLFDQGKYEEAVALYNLITTKVKNGDLFYNLGNAYLKLGRLGEAILNYRNAQAYMPRDEDLAANLKFTRQLTKDKIEKKPGYSIIHTICFWYDSFNLRELLGAFLVMNGIFWILALFRIWFRKELLYWSFLTSLILLAITGATLGVKLYNTSITKEGVVTTNELAVRAGNGPNNTVLFYLHDGAEFRIMDRRAKGWLKIELPDGKKGWVQKKFVGIVGE